MVYPFLWLVMGCKLTNSQEHARTKIMLIELLAQLGPPPFFPEVLSMGAQSGNLGTELQTQIGQ